jgi:hypothetical protein
MTQIVWISGPADDLRALLHVEGLSIGVHSGATTATGARRVTAYATDAGVAEAQRRGLTVEVVVDAQTLTAQDGMLLDQIERAPGEVVEPEVS